MANQRKRSGCRSRTNRRAASGLAGVVMGLLTLAAMAAGDEPQVRKPIDFAHDIVPLIKAHCAACHTDGKYKGSFSLDTREAMLKSEAVIPGKSGESDLIERVMSNDPEFRMPQKGKRLTTDEIAKLKSWIDQGASWENGFTFKRTDYAAPLKLRRPELPPSRNGRNHPVDRIVDAYFLASKLNRPAPLDDAGFVRRVFLDVIGLLPPPEELEPFVLDAAPDKRARLIHRVLDDRRAYADHWLTFWNDLLRNEYVGTGYIDGGRKQITGWLYQSVIENKPYDRFVRELISPASESEGFIKGIKWRGRVNASQVREIQFSQNVSQVFFGANLKCASCHDSFIDRWKLVDAYGLAAVIAEAAVGDRPLRQTDRKDGCAEVPLARAGHYRPLSVSHPAVETARRTGDASGQWPISQDDRQPHLAAAHGAGDRPSGRCDGQRALERGSARVSVGLPCRSPLRPQGTDRAHRWLEDLSVEPGGCLRRRRSRGLRLPGPHSEADDRRAVPGRGVVGHGYGSRQTRRDRFTRPARRPRVSTDSSERRWSSRMN